MNTKAAVLSAMGQPSPYAQSLPLVVLHYPYFLMASMSLLPVGWWRQCALAVTRSPARKLMELKLVEWKEASLSATAQIQPGPMVRI